MWTRRLFLASTAGVLYAADDAPASAESILETAKSQAADGRAIWVLFHASW